MLPAFTISFPFLFPERTLTIPFYVNKFPNKLVPRVPNNIFKNSPFCSFSFFIVLVTSIAEATAVISNDAKTCFC